jgi:hypothetical protein
MRLVPLVLRWVSPLVRRGSEPLVVLLGRLPLRVRWLSIHSPYLPVPLLGSVVGFDPSDSPPRWAGCDSFPWFAVRFPRWFASVQSHWSCCWADRRCGCVDSLTRLEVAVGFNHPSNGYPFEEGMLPTAPAISSFVLRVPQLSIHSPYLPVPSLGSVVRFDPFDSPPLWAGCDSFPWFAARFPRWFAVVQSRWSCCWADCRCGCVGAPSTRRTSRFLRSGPS